MSRIAKIVIKGTSGFCFIEEAYKDKVTITSRSISYQYTPQIESENHRACKWRYQIDSESYQAYFEQICTRTIAITKQRAEIECLDIGSIEFIITYQDLTKEVFMYWLPADTFDALFRLIKDMLPRYEKIPNVLMTSSDEDLQG